MKQKLIDHCKQVEKYAMDVEDRDNYGPMDRLMAQAALAHLAGLPSNDLHAALQRWLTFGRAIQDAGSQLARNLIADTEFLLSRADVTLTNEDTKQDGNSQVMPDYEGTTMTQRECYQAGLEAGKALAPDGWKLVPIEPTKSMIVDGFESEPDEDFSKSEEWEEYQSMSGCRQAAHRARLCWAAMLAAAPKPGHD